MSIGADLAATGRHDLLPGYILSPADLGAIAEAEDFFERELSRKCGALARDLPAGYQKELAGMFYADVRSRVMAFGLSRFTLWAHFASYLPMMVWILAKIKHPQLTLDAVRAALAALPQGGIEIQDDVMHLWGYLPPEPAIKPAKQEALDWEKVFGFLTTPEPKGPGLTYAEASKLTLAQVQNLYTGGKPQPVSDDDIADHNRRRRVEAMDRVLEANGWLPSALTPADYAAVAAAIQKETGHAVDPAAIPGALAEYAVEKLRW